MFAQSLTKIVASKKMEQNMKAQLGAKWTAQESILLDRALEVFKLRCCRQAEARQCGMSVSFEVLTREIEGFPKRSLQNSTYYVHDLGDGVTAEQFVYATKGSHATYNKDEPILFAELLESLMPKLVERLRPLGFTDFGREAGTWRLSVTWQDPDEVTEKKQKHHARLRSRSRSQSRAMSGGA